MGAAFFLWARPRRSSDARPFGHCGEIASKLSEVRGSRNPDAPSSIFNDLDLWLLSYFIL